jgi:intein/homing endonuclease
MKKVIWKEDRRYNMVICFLPEQLINMADGTLKPIGDIVLGDEIQVFKLNEEELYHSNSIVWKETNRIYANLNSEQIGQLETSVIKSIQHKLHSNVYELYLENGKVLKPTGNHPFFTDKGWTTIDGHNPNHAGESGYLKVGDKVFDVNVNDWISVIDIKSLEGEYKTINLVDTNTNTIIADGILTHNSCFLPQQKITTSDGTLKPIEEVNVGDEVKVFDVDKDEVRLAKVNEVRKLIHDDVYELKLETDKILYPTGNHPFWTKDKEWTTIDGHDPNHGGGFEHLEVGDFVQDIDGGWVKVENIEVIEGEHLVYNFVDMSTGTIIADGIVTHNSSAVSGVEGLEHKLWKELEEEVSEVLIEDITEGDKVLSYNFDSGVESTEVIQIKKDTTSGKVTLEVGVGSNVILFTSTHILPYYRNDDLIEDNMGTLEVGDEVIVYNHSESEASRVAVDTISQHIVESENEVIHPITVSGYYFVNNILVEG